MKFKRDIIRNIEGITFNYSYDLSLNELINLYNDLYNCNVTVDDFKEQLKLANNSDEDKIGESIFDYLVYIVDSKIYDNFINEYHL